MLYRIYRFSEWLASWMPERIAYAIARVVGNAMFIFARNIRQTIMANQRHVTPDAPRKQIARNARLAAIGVAKNYYDLFRLPSMTLEDLLRIIEGRGIPFIWEAHARGKGVIIVAPHMGTYSLVPSFAIAIGLPAVCVVEHIPDPRLHEYFFRLRANHIELLTTGPEDIRRILRALRDGKVVIMLADRDVGTSSDEVEFFGARTRLPAGPALLARRTGAAVVMAYSYRVGNTKSVAEAFPALTFPQTVGTLEQRRAADTQVIARELEKMISSAPDQWAVLQPVWPRTRAVPTPELSEAAG